MLLTKENKKALPALYSQEENKDPMVPLKFFTPTSSFTWFVTEGEPINFRCTKCKGMQERNEDGTCIECGHTELEQVGDNWLFFGKVISHLCPDGELGYTTLDQLREITGPMGLGVERDMYWSPKPLSECG
jgi:hypothetical protein